MRSIVSIILSIILLAPTTSGVFAMSDRASENDNRPTNDNKQPSDTTATSPNESGKNVNADEVKVKVLPQTNKIIVEGRSLTGQNSVPRQIGYRLLLPVASIARALGDSISADPSAGTVEVRRQSGVVADFNPQLNQVRENGSVVLSTSGITDTIFTSNVDDILLPVEIVSALLDVSIFFDEAASAIRINRGHKQANLVRPGSKHSAIEFYQGSYDYSMNMYSSTFDHTLTTRAEGRIYDGRFNFITNSGGGTNNPFSAIRRGTFTYERPNGQKFIGGDFGTGTDLVYMSSSVRGGLAELPVKGAKLVTFAGRTISGILPTTVDQFEYVPPGAPPKAESQQLKYTYDTTVIGGYLTFDPSSKKANRESYNQFSLGGLHFHGPNNKGQIMTGSMRYGNRRSHLQADLAFGHASGLRLNNEKVSGMALAADVSGSFNVTDNLSLQGRYVHIGKNFMGPQAGLYEPLKLLSGGAVWRPRQWLSTGFSATTSNKPNSSRDGSITSTLNIIPNNFLPTVFFSHTQGMGRNKGNAYTLLNLTKDFSKWNLFVNTVRVKAFSNTFFNSQIGSNIRINDFNTVQATQSFGNKGALNGSLDWMASSFLSNRLSFTVGASYYHNKTSSTSVNGRLSASVKLPAGHSFQVNYLHSQTGPQLLLNVRGPLLPHRKTLAEANAPVSEMNSYGAFYGRVYQDINLNGKFDSGVDMPQANVKVRVDGNRYAESDANGIYRIEDVKSGSHNVYLDLLTVRADLTILDNIKQSVALPSGQDLIVDFRLVRTGRVSGIVWFDKNENGELGNDEQPLGDIRIVSSSGSDTLTDTDGVFVIGDLPPGEHTLLIDEKTLPDNTRSIAGTLPIKINAGAETSGIKFPVRAAAAEIKRF